MITKSDWEAVRQQFERQNHQMSDPPPTNEELFAYTRGELRGEQAERVREYLAANPDVARALTEPFPEDDARPGDLGYLSPQDLEKQWALLQKELHGEGSTTVVPFPPERRWRRLAMALAAMLALAFFGNLWQAWNHNRLSKRPGQWAIASEQVLLPPEEGQRGPGDATPPTLTLEKDTYALVLQPSGTAETYGEYRIETVNVGTSEVVRRQSGFRRGSDGTITIFLDRDDLEPGEYRFRLYGLDGDRAVALETYPLRVR